MKLVELKKKTLALIEEINPDVTSLTDDPDIAAKLPYVINQVLFELARFKKIPGYYQIDVEKDDIFDLTSLDNFYQLNIIKNVEYDHLDDTHVQFLDNGNALIKYYKYPERITPNSNDNMELDLSDDALEIAPYGIAADILKADVSNQYGTIYERRYREMLQMLDSRYTLGTVEFDGGLEI